jgi:hypothetical protein
VNVWIPSPSQTLIANIPCGTGNPFALQIPKIYYDSQTMTRIGANPLDPHMAAVIAWATFFGSAWPYPIPNE